MSILGKKWNILNEAPSASLLDVLLKNRGITSDAARQEFLRREGGALHDPFLLKGMPQAVERVQRAIASHEKVMVFGDYDVDGITGTALLYSCLKEQGADIFYTLPDREKDGYGLKEYFIRRFADQGIQLLITVDCGTANLHEITLARSLGIDVIVVDHHQIPAELPPANALINPHQEDCAYPYEELCGSTLAYKLIMALEKSGVALGDPLYQLSLVVMGIVGDCMPLLDENRVLAKAGLEALRHTTHPGIQSLLMIAGVKRDKIDTTAVGFQLAPRLNAAGRMETPYHSLELLLGKTEKAAVLNSLNQQRQALVESHMKDALEQLAKKESIPLVIVLASPEWRSGVLGLIASKMVERFQRPAIILNDQGHQLVASCRSLGSFDITDFLRQEAASLFTSFGGHTMAGGFTLPKQNWELFQETVAQTAPRHIDPADLKGELMIDCELPPEKIHFEHLTTVQEVHPFGMQNPEPLFVLKNATISGVRPVGAAANHLQLKISSGGKTFSAIAFRFGEHTERIGQMESADIAFHLELNEWNGIRSLQLKVVDIADAKKR